MIVKIKSKNKNLLDILMKNKNVDGGLYLRALKNGTAIGVFVSDYEYHLVFNDSKYSYSEPGSTQIDFKSFCSPQVILGLLNTILREQLSESFPSKVLSWLNTDVKSLDIDVETEIEVVNIWSDKLSSDSFVLSKYYSEYITIKKKEELPLFNLKIKTNSVLKSINMLAFVALYLSAINSDEFFVDNELVTKYIKILNNIGSVPYTIANLFSKKFMLNKNTYLKNIKALESVCDDEVSIKFGTTQQQRVDGIKNIIGIPTETNVVEIGCGEMDYAFAIAKSISGKWLAVDLDDYSKIAEVARTKTGCDIIFSNTLYDERVKDIDNVLMLAVEVIEHQDSPDKAFELIDNALLYYKPKRFIISTPNFDFNKFYNMNTTFRHKDHKFEFTKNEFNDFIKKIAANEYSIVYHEVSNVVNGIESTLCAELIRK